MSTSRLMELHPRRFFLDVWRRIDAEAATERAQQSSYDWRPLVAFSAGAVFLSLMEYFGDARTFARFITALKLDLTGQAYWYELYTYVWWAGWRVLGYFVLPALVVKLVFRSQLRTYGLSVRGIREHAWLYVLMFMVVAVGIAFASTQPAFLSYYPFYGLAGRSWFDFVAWELLYASQFFALEFFFRGFLLKASKTMMGSHSIFAMVVPYCMIHYGKPFLEVLAAIIAGIVLGTLAMRTRSIWSGVFIHVAVAVSMDTVALWKVQGLP